MTQSNSYLQRLLGNHHPISPLSPEETEQYVDTHYRRNYAANLSDGAWFWFGSSLISSATILPVFISRLSDSPFAIGLLAMIAQGGWLLPQIFSANFTEQQPRMLPIVVNLGFFTERLPLFLLAGAALLAIISPMAALILALLAFAWHTLGAGIIAPAWQDMLARVIPIKKRGGFMGVTTFIGTAAGAGASALSILLLDHYPFPMNYALLFLMGALAIFISWLCLMFVKEPAGAPQANPISNRQYLGELPIVVRSDTDFRNFLIGRLVLALGTLATGFVAVSAVQTWDLPDSSAGLFAILYLVGQSLGNLIFGFLADRYGHKLSLELGAFTAAIAFLMAWFATAPIWIYIVLVLIGMQFGANFVSGTLIVLEYGPEEKRPTYIGLANTSVGIVSALAPLIGAWLAGFSYDWLFALAAVLNLAAFATIRLKVIEPRRRKTALSV